MAHHKYWPRFSAEAFISLIVRGHLELRPPMDDPCAPCPEPPPPPLLLFPLPTAFPGECSDWLLWRLMVGSRATKDALCLKLEDARLMRDLRFDPNLSGGFRFGVDRVVIYLGTGSYVCVWLRFYWCEWMCVMVRRMVMPSGMVRDYLFDLGWMEVRFKNNEFERD